MHFHYVDINSGESRRSLASDLPAAVSKRLHPLMKCMHAGEKVPVSDTHSCRLLKSNSKMAVFEISKTGSSAADTLLLSVCLHGRTKRRAWEAVGGLSLPPQAPFIAVYTENDADAADPELIGLVCALAWNFYQHDDR